MLKNCDGGKVLQSISLRSRVIIVVVRYTRGSSLLPAADGPAAGGGQAADGQRSPGTMVTKKDLSYETTCASRSPLAPSHWLTVAAHIYQLHSLVITGGGAGPGGAAHRAPGTEPGLRAQAWGAVQRLPSGWGTSLAQCSVSVGCTLQGQSSRGMPVLL
jgi:hypothetical protein